MNRQASPFDPDVDRLIQNGRIVRPVPDVVRARSLARARATVTAAATHAPETSTGLARRLLPIAIAASLALAVGVAGALAALGGLTPKTPVRVPPVRPKPLVPGPSHAPAMQPPPMAAPQSESSAKPLRHTARMTPPKESYAAELDLLQRAQAAFTDRSYTLALALIAEHGRKFPNGRLAEEREALRVRSLDRAGRKEAAARAAAAFSTRFPRSAIPPRLGSEP